MQNFTLFALWKHVVQEHTDNLRFGTAHIYKCALQSFSLYNKGVEPAWTDITPALLKQYEHHLLKRNLSWNTIATYIKSFRTIYNLAVRRGIAPFVPYLFHSVCTSPREARRKTVNAAALATLIGEDKENKGENRSEKSENPPKNRSREKARKLFLLMFLLRGIPFVDVIHLRQADVRGDVLTYHRRKTRRRITVRLTPEAQTLIRSLQSLEQPRSGYLLPVLTRPDGTCEAYREYQCALRRFNRQLRRLAADNEALAGLSGHQARHLWATVAYHMQMQPGLISEALGHSSITITEHYLRAFHNEAIDAANNKVIAHVMNLRGQQPLPPE